MKLKALAVAISTVGLLAACAGVSTDSLRRVAEQETISIQQPVFWKLGTWDMTLRSGSYVGTYEDARGTYFVGPKPCLFTTAGRRPDSVGIGIECAIFIPNAATGEPLVMQRIGSDVPHTGFHTDGNPVIRDSPPIAAKPDAALPDTHAIASTAAPNAGQGTLVAGGAIAAGIVSGIVQAEQGRLAEFKTQPEKGWLKR